MYFVSLLNYHGLILNYSWIKALATKFNFTSFLAISKLIIPTIQLKLCMGTEISEISIYISRKIYIILLNNFINFINFIIALNHFTSITMIRNILSKPLERVYIPWSQFTVYFGTMCSKHGSIRLSRIFSKYFCDELGNEKRDSSIESCNVEHVSVVFDACVQIFLTASWGDQPEKIIINKKLQKSSCQYTVLILRSDFIMLWQF